MVGAEVSDERVRTTAGTTAETAMRAANDRDLMRDVIMSRL